MKKNLIADVCADAGVHNINIEASRARLQKGRTYEDLSTICIIPTRGTIHHRVVQSWMSMMTPMNQKFFRIFVPGMEVGDAYNYGIEQVLANAELSKWKYILTLEEDNCPPADGLLKMYEGMKRFDVIGGLYWTKGENGQPMIYGDPQVFPRNCIPQVPKLECLHECNGLGMGFNLFKMDIFRKMPKPWFKTVQEVTSGGAQMFTQDLYFYENAAKAGYRFACDTRIKVGHFDADNNFMW